LVKTVCNKCTKNGKLTVYDSVKNKMNAERCKVDNVNTVRQ
jgi:hypothetical protein